jgi:hypothetical protein
MITDSDVLNAQQLIANSITTFNYQLSQTDPAFPRQKVKVQPQEVQLQEIVDKTLMEFRHAGWHCYASPDRDRIFNIGSYLKADKMHIQFSGFYGHLAYIMAIEKK